MGVHSMGNFQDMISAFFKILPCESDVPSVLDGRGRLL